MSPTNLLLATLAVPMARQGVLSPQTATGVAGRGGEDDFSSIFEHLDGEVAGTADPAALLAHAAIIPVAASGAAPAETAGEAPAMAMSAQRQPLVTTPQMALAHSAQHPPLPVILQGELPVAASILAASALPVAPSAGLATDPVTRADTRVSGSGALAEASALPRPALPPGGAMSDPAMPVTPPAAGSGAEPETPADPAHEPLPGVPTQATDRQTALVRPPGLAMAQLMARSAPQVVPATDGNSKPSGPPGEGHTAALATDGIAGITAAREGQASGQRAGQGGPQGQALPAHRSTGAAVLAEDGTDRLAGPFLTAHGAGQSTGSIAPATGAPAHDMLARHVASQVADMAVRAEPRGAEIRLDPEELGRLRLALRVDGQSIQVMIAAERPETTDLIRRHIDLLAQEFRQLGYRDVSFSFAGSQGDGAAQQGLPPPPRPADGHADRPAPMQPDPTATLVAARQPANAAGRLDLRL
ncbi:MAG: hypothetical protein GW886_05515 [Rhodobacterales bacterium]|nr:hypothetical protein [Rhodobacterales bacterium]